MRIARNRIYWGFGASLLLAACGGGGGETTSGGNNPPPSTPVAATHSLIGLVQRSAFVSVHLIGPQSVPAVTKTDVDGIYRFDNLPDGNYVVSPSEPSLEFTPVRTTVTLQGDDLLVPDFVSSPAPPSLTEADLVAIESLPESSLTLSEMLNPDGQSVADYLQSRGIILPTEPSQLFAVSAPASATQLRPNAAIATTSNAAFLPPANSSDQRKKDVIDAMVGIASFLACGRASPRCTTWDFPADPASPTINPAQLGLAYVWGGKTPNVRTLPSDGCTQALFGVDCSGLISVIATFLGMSAPDGTAKQVDPNKWVIPTDWGLKLAGVTDASRQLGDIVVWSGHIGIITTGSTVVEVISSTGGRAQCTTNAKPKKGPRSVRLASLIDGSPPTWNGLGPPIAILRLQPFAPVASTLSVLPLTIPYQAILGAPPNPTGSIVSSPEGINCVEGGGTCSYNFPEGTAVTLSEVPRAGAVFRGWRGACSGTASCVVLMDRTQQVGAYFAQVFKPSWNIKSQTCTLVGTEQDLQSGQYVKVFNLTMSGSAEQSSNTLQAGTIVSDYYPTGISADSDSNVVWGCGGWSQWKGIAGGRPTTGCQWSSLRPLTTSWTLSRTARLPESWFQTDAYASGMSWTGGFSSPSGTLSVIQTYLLSDPYETGNGLGYLPFPDFVVSQCN